MSALANAQRQLTHNDKRKTSHQKRAKKKNKEEETTFTLNHIPQCSSATPLQRNSRQERLQILRLSDDVYDDKFYLHFDSTSFTLIVVYEETTFITSSKHVL